MADLTQQILDFAGKGPGGLDEESRLALLQASFKLTAALENPFEKTVRMLFVRSSGMLVSTLHSLTSLEYLRPHSPSYCNRLRPR
jgi:hypothetical protein